MEPVTDWPVRNRRKVWSAQARRLESPVPSDSMLKRLIILPLGVTTLAYGLSGGLLAGCSVLIDVDGKQCSTSQDCAALGAAFSGATCEQNLCVLKTPTGAAGSQGVGGDASMPDPLECEKQEPSTEAMVKYTFAPIFATGSEPKDHEPLPFHIVACSPADLECAKPVFGPLDVMPGQPQDFLVPRGFQGYFYATNPDTIDALIFMGRAIVKDTIGWNVTVPTPALVAGFGLATNEQVNPDLGLIIAVARDCDQAPLEGVKFTSSKEGLRFYFVNSFPDTTLTETGSQGAVGFANVPISTATLKATAASGRELAPAIIRLKPRTASLVELFP